MSLYNNICLLGYKCTGKSYVAGLLAKKLNWKLYSIDKIIQREQNQSMRALTDNYKDWKNFRNMEYRLLAKLLKMRNVIIDCNDGVGTNPVNGRAESNLLKSRNNTLKVLLKANNTFLAQKLKKRVAKIKKTNNKSVLQLALKKEFTILHIYAERYAQLADIELRFNAYINLSPVLNCFKDSQSSNNYKPLSKYNS